MVSSNSNSANSNGGNRSPRRRKRSAASTASSSSAVQGITDRGVAAGADGSNSLSPSPSQNFTGRQRIVLETNKARDKAEVLLAGLINAQRAVDRQDPRSGAGRIISSASMDRAISATKRLIATLNGELKCAEADLVDDELSILDEIDVNALALGSGGTGNEGETASPQVVRSNLLRGAGGENGSTSTSPLAAPTSSSNSQQQQQQQPTQWPHRRKPRPTS